MDMANFIWLLTLLVPLAPALLVIALGVTSLLERPMQESTTSRCVYVAVLTSLLSACALLALHLFNVHSPSNIDPDLAAVAAEHSLTHHYHLDLGDILHLDDYHFAVRLQYDYLSLPFTILSLVLCGTVSGFATRYLHREPGYNRFFVLFSVFTLGMVISATAGTIETLFTGWELVGLSSTFLVSFFHERPGPVANGWRIWNIYRVADAAFLIAAVLVHHLRGLEHLSILTGDLDAHLHLPLNTTEALIVGGLLLVAAAGKSALIPFSGWLPRAMEGPTPSSAVFYGALSVHLGAYLLLRVSPVLEATIWLGVIVTALGLSTAIFAAVVSRVQTDIKSMLCYASLTQVGIIVAEIGVASMHESLDFLYVIALIHILGNACVRMLQFLRASTILLDYRVLENAIGGHLPKGAQSPPAAVPSYFQMWVYRWALERGYLDAFLQDWIARPFLNLLKWCDNNEKRWTDFISGKESRESEHVKPMVDSLEDYL